jgi:catalase
MNKRNAAIVAFTAVLAAIGGPAVWALVARADKPKAATLTQDDGRPVGNNQDSRTAGEDGPALLDNFHLIQKLARFDRERIPERVVHASGVGALGEFVCYADQSAHTRAKLFSAKGKKTPVFLRFSLVIPSRDAPESTRDPRGFSTKFYTEEGNWDLVGNNMPVFFIRDSMKFADLVHSFKPSPITNLQDTARRFDFLSHHPESTHMITFLYCDQGTPSNLRQMDGFGVHAFKWVNAGGKVTYVKFNWRSMQGLAPMAEADAIAAAAKEPKFHTKDLYDNIKAGKFPSWELGVQMLSPDRMAGLDFDPLDATKIWPDVTEVKVGKMTLNRVPPNFFQFTEQSAFDPGILVPGIEASEDKLLQGRVFSYADTQRYRVGTNYLMLPVNRPRVAVNSNNQDGRMNFGVTESDTNYEPSIHTGGRTDSPTYEASKAPLKGNVVQRKIRKEQNFVQAGALYESFSEKHRANLIKNLAGDLGVADPAVKTTIVSFAYQAHEEYGTRLAKAVGVELDAVKAMVKRQPAPAGK